MKVAVVGAKGFVGSEIAKVVEKSPLYELVPIVRGDDAEKIISNVDIVIHAANPAGRYSAENNKEKDFKETIEKTSILLKYSQNKKFILVSSVSCRTQLNLAYGRHRRACELMALSHGATVVRLGPMYGGSRAKDTLHSILANEQVFVSEKTEYAYTNVKWCAEEIVKCIGSDILEVELLAKNKITLLEIKKYFSSTSKFVGEVDNQVALLSDETAPDSRLVLKYAESELKDINRWKI